eukprot:c17856_g1_i2.p1 GENE.c17856_g1_i2~~c17856_g1_i2.p1  ORF type:complete len:426 (-),score=144.75 c17856_g1_i2:16-1293(-)
MQALRQFDLYQKADEAFRIRTLSGAFVSIMCIVISAILFYSEFISYLQVTRVDTLHVDTGSDYPLSIFIDIVFPGMPCSELHLDVEESTGEQQVDIHKNLAKLPIHETQPATRQQAVLMVRRLEIRLKSVLEKISNEEIGSDDVIDRVQNVQDKIDSLKEEYSISEEDYKVPENYCGSCYGAGEPGECCNTCDNVREAYKLKKWVISDENTIEQCAREKKDNEVYHMTIEGCNIVGHIETSKVSGNFHFAPGASSKQEHLDLHGHTHGHHVHEFSLADLAKFNVSHQIKALSFGDRFPGMINPLDKSENILPGTTGSGMYRYFLKIVPTTYITYEGEKLITNQYSVTQHFKPADMRLSSFSIPGVFFVYEISPIAVTLRETSPSLPTFLTKICAIIGGVVAVAGLFDAIVYQSSKKIKESLGKQY